MLETRLFPTTGTEIHTVPEIADNRATENIVRKFIAALIELESAREVDQLVALFADDCEIGNPVFSGTFRGHAGARNFWTAYRRFFKDVCSIFENEIYSGNSAKLEWKTEGKSRTGRKIKYEGSSLLGIENDRIIRFEANFDPVDLERQPTGKNVNNNSDKNHSFKSRSIDIL